MFCAAINIDIPAIKLQEENKAENKMIDPSTGTSLLTVLKNV